VLVVSVIVETNSRHGRTVTMETSVLAPNIGIDHPIAKALLPEL
jgi:hypothetical protein